MSWRRVAAIGVALSWLAFAAALLSGGSVLAETPPLLLVGAMTTVGAGVVWGLVSAIGGWLLAALLGSPISGASLAYLVGSSLVIVVLTDRLVAELRRVRGDAERGLGLLSVLLAGLRRVAGADGSRSVDATLPGVLEGAHGAGFGVWRTVDGALEPVAGDIDSDNEAWILDAVRQVVSEKRGLSRSVDTPAGRRQVEAFPVFEHGDVAAVVTSAQDARLPASDRAVVQEFASTLGHLIQRVYEERTGLLMLDLVEQRVAGPGTAGMGRALLDLVVPELVVWGGVVMRYRAGRFVAEAATESLSGPLRNRLVRGLEFGEGLAWQVRKDGHPAFIRDYPGHPAADPELVRFGVGAVAMIPVGSHPCEHIVVLIHDAERDWSARDRSLLGRLVKVLAAAVAQREAETRLDEMARLQRELLSTPPDRMYPRLLDAAVRLVPGSEAASMLVRGDDASFRFVATVGYELEAFSEVRWSAEAMSTWYAEGTRGWRTGQPRVLVSSEERSVEDLSALSAPEQGLRQASRVREIVANLCLPVVYEGEVLAVVNLDALRDPDAFGGSALTAARGLAPFVGFLLHEAHLRRQLEAAARSDELTGLANRRAFNEQAARHVARAGRYGEPLALLVMDLQQFKKLNDAAGHDAGDQALVAVADALRRSIRAGDAAYRWGGDEFAALLPHADVAGARETAQRVAAAVAGVELPEGQLSVNIGIACLPADGQSVDALLRTADRRMYAAKAKAVPLILDDEAR